MKTRALAAAMGCVLYGCASLALAAEPAAPAKQAASNDPLATALLGGKPSLGFRLRYEGVEDDAVRRDAGALTLRTRLGYATAPLHGVTLQLELDDVRALVDDYNSTNGGDVRRPVVGDPEGTEVNVAALAWTAGAHAATLGRQRITYDNHRFVGNVGWRQNEQTYDSVSFRTKALPKTELQYAYVANVNRVYGPRNGGAQAANWHGDTHLFNAKLALGAAGSLSAFAYLMEFDNAQAQSNATYGLLWTGSVPLAGEWKLPFAASYASQDDYGGNPVAYSADYRQLEAGIAYRAVTLKVGREVLSGDATRAGHAFRTPLATLHAFQGWADKFLTTPNAGIEDTYAGVTAKVAGVDLQAWWHDFDGEAVSRDYGTELNLSAGYKFANRYEVLVKFADYRADGFATDTRKYWLQFGATF